MLRLAWRNVWRNRRRTFITVASIACGLAAIMFGQSMIKTIQYQLIEKATGVITGHIQVMDARVRNYKFPEKAVDRTDPVARALARLGGGMDFEARMLVTGLVSSPKDSVGVLIVGVEPERDVRITTMHAYMVSGAYLTGRPGEIVMGDALAENLGIRIGDKAVVLAQAADGSMGAENFRLVGLYHTGSQSFDASIVYLPLPSFQAMLAMEGRANDFVIRLHDPERLEEALSEVRRAVSGLGVQVLSWRDVDQELVGIQKYQNAILLIMLLIVFAIVALGILNTMLMSMFERVREFGILMALGARPGWVLRLLVLESCLLGLLGTAAGLAAGAAVILHFKGAGLRIPLKEAIGYFLPFDTTLYLRFVWPYHRMAVAAVLATCVLAALPPGLRAARLKAAEALRHL